MNTLNQSRRSFLKTTGLTLGGVATVGMAAQLPARALAEGNDAAASVDQITWDEEYDVIVVGAGLAGIATATTVALESNGATCLLLEKSSAELGGGNTQFSAGMVLWTKDVEGFTEYLKELRGDMDYDMDVVVDWDTMDEGDLTTHVGSRHGHMQFGGEWPHLPMPKDTWFICDADGYAAGMNDGFPTFGCDPIAEGGYGYQADTLEELAEQAGMPAEELVKTVEQWNECCANGEDVYFHRPANTMKTIENPPFYALHCSATMLNTDGGPRRSPKGEILNLDGEPIPGLYSAGEFGSIWCNMYNGGGNLGECLAFGRISARNCLGIA